MQDKPLSAVEMLTQGKTDTELLEALVAALTDNNEDLIGKLEGVKNYDPRAGANLLVVSSIVAVVKNRTKSVAVHIGDDPMMAVVGGRW